VTTTREARSSEASRPTLVPFRPSASAVVTISADWRYTAVTEAAAALSGSTRDAMLGAAVWDLFPQVRQRPIGLLMQTVMRSRVAGEIRTPRLDAASQDVVACVTPHKDGGIRVAFRFSRRRAFVEDLAEATTAALPLSFLPWAMTAKCWLCACA
jgi:PAS domain-containing protein